MRTALALLVALAAAPARADAPPPPPPPAAPAEAPAWTPDEDDVRARAEDEERQKRVKPPVDLDLDHRIKPVSGSLFVKSGRHELGPAVGTSLSDAFFTKYVAGGRYAYHLDEAFSLGAQVLWATATPAGSLAKCDSSGQNCHTPTRNDLARAPGDFDLIADADLAWAPLYGKISIVAESVLHFDTYLLAGGGVIRTRLEAPGQAAITSELRPQGHVALGQRYYLGKAAVIRLELRDYGYGLTIDGRQGPVKRFENQLLFTLGVSFFLGSPPES